MHKLVALLTRSWIALVATTLKPEVYLCVIPNRGTQLVTIDDNSWKPSNHKAVGSGNTNLYAWLTGEDHFVTVGSEDRCYILSQTHSHSTNKANIL